MNELLLSWCKKQARALREDIISVQFILLLLCSKSVIGVVQVRCAVPDRGL